MATATAAAEVYGGRCSEDDQRAVAIGNSMDVEIEAASDFDVAEYAAAAAAAAARHTVDDDDDPDACCPVLHLMPFFCSLESERLDGSRWGHEIKWE